MAILYAETCCYYKLGLL